MSSRFDRYGDYIVDRRESLGSGTYGTVWRGYRIVQGREGEQDYLEPVAIKQSAYDLKNIQQISTLQILNHPNIIRYIDYKISKDSLYLVMELCEGGTLEDLLMSFSDDQDRTPQAIYYYSQIVSGIKFMYRKNILHRDIKPSNILIKDNRIKIADFGTSKLKSENEMIRTLVGTPLFASPQVLELSLGDEQSYTQKSDIWSLGLILYFMYHYEKSNQAPLKRIWDSLPWRGKTSLQVLNNIRQQPLQFRCQNIPEEIKNIIGKMLTVDVQQRMSFQEFFQIKLFQRESDSRDRKEDLSKMEQSAVELKFSETLEYNEYELTLLNECTHQPQFIKRETIDFELLKLLEIKNCDDHEERQIWDALKFYELLREQAEQSNDHMIYNDLIFEIDCQIYQLLLLKRFLVRKLSSSQKAIRKSTHLQQQNGILAMFDPLEEPRDDSERQIHQKVQGIEQRYFLYGQRFQTTKLSIRQLLQDLFSTSNILEKEKLIMSLILPSDHLLLQVKGVLKKMRPVVEESKSKLSAAISRLQIYLIYDLLSTFALDYVWQLKRHSKNKAQAKSDFFEHYRSQRKKISISQIVGRIQIAYETMKL